MAIWIEDADEITMTDDVMRLFYQNDRVKDFIQMNKVLGVSGIKGQGKTFLLKIKRSIAMKDNIDCLPNDFMVDQLDGSTRIPHELKRFMLNYSNWVDMWKVAIALTIIKYMDLKPLYVKVNKEFLSIVDSMIVYDNYYLRPSVYINYMLQMKPNELDLLFEHVSELLHSLQIIHNALYIFIDKTDQAFVIDGDVAEENYKYWKMCQYALANASYEIYASTNNHIKVYFSIRQEALIDSANIIANKKRNIESFVINLEYEKQDLEQMFEIYVSEEYKYNGTQNAARAFLGIETIKNQHIKNMDEKVFEYIYRHSLKRPSDIMKICKKLSRLSKRDITEELIRTTVNECASEILEMYIGELKPFLPYRIDGLWKRINTNIINKEYMAYVCRNNRDDNKDYECSRNCKICPSYTPFKELYNIGLLGYLENDLNNKRQIQRFNRIGDESFLNGLSEIPSSKYYFLHPCIMDAMHERNNQYDLNNFIDDRNIVGDSYPFVITDGDDIEKNIEVALASLKNEDIFISSTILDLEEERSAIRAAVIRRGYHPIMSESSDFLLSSDELIQQHSHDYCINKMLECGMVIYVFGKKRGGAYSGTLYEEYKKRIIKESGGRITEPSISLMEVYVAICEKKSCYVFISKEFDLDQESWHDIKNEYQFLNHLRVGNHVRNNWMSRYENMVDLENRIQNLVFKRC